MKIDGIYLAAGESIRMGQSNLARTVGTMTLGSLALQTALQTSLKNIHVIVNETDDVSWLPHEIKTHQYISIVPCSSNHEGQSPPLHFGIREAQKTQADAIVIMHADQPFITALMIEEMILCIQKTPSLKFIATTSNDIITTPVLFSSTMYDALLELTGEPGAKSLLKSKLLHEEERLPCTDKRLVFDIDTIENYEELLSILKF